MNVKNNDFVAFTQKLVFLNKHKICSGGSWYDRSHHYSTPKTINSQTKIFKINDRKLKRKQKRKY